MFLLELYLQQFFVFVLVLTRISGLVLTAPIFGPRGVPVRIRAFLAIGLSLIIVPLQDGATTAIPSDLINMLLVLAREALLGVALGLSVLILFAGLQLTGHVIGQLSGMALADVYDPTYEASVPVFAELLDLLAIAVFLVVGGHRHVLGALLDSFQARPPGNLDLPSGLAAALSSLVGESFVIGLRAGAPIIISLLMAMLILGLISRTLPQLNVLVVGFSLNALILLAVLAVSLGAIVGVVVLHADTVIETIHRALVVN